MILSINFECNTCWCVAEHQSSSTINGKDRNIQNIIVDFQKTVDHKIYFFRVIVDLNCK